MPFAENWDSTMACDNDKFAVPLADGSQVEAVWYPSGTLCLSTQVGCAMGCSYCASGRDGLQRSLTTEELAAQVVLGTGRGHAIERLTLSGIGEPLQALEAVTSFMANSNLAGVCYHDGSAVDGSEALAANAS